MSAVAPIGVIDHFNLLERLPPSGPGDLFRARDTRRGRTVVIRRLPPGCPVPALTAPAARVPFLERARALAALSHPNATRLYEVGEESDGALYLAFEFLQGQPLRAEMAGRPLPVRRAVGYAIQIADAIAEAHAAGYLHGGLSPDTVTITARGHAKIPVLDLATRAGFDSRTGTLIDYSSPEELAGGIPDERSDVFSAGAILYEMLTGRRPSARGSSAPSASNAHVPKELDAALLMAVAPDPARRFASARALVEALRAMAETLDQQAGDDEDLTPMPPTSRDGRRRAPNSLGANGRWLVVGVAAALAGFAAWWLTRG